MPPGARGTLATMSEQCNATIVRVVALTSFLSCVAVACERPSPPPSAARPAAPAAPRGAEPDGAAAHAAEQPKPPAPSAVAHPEVPVPEPPDLRAPPPAGIVVAVGDVHGDLAATREVLRRAGLIDEADRWIGGNAVLVQTGDQLDRGDDEPEILLLFDRLAAEAKAAGGAVYALLGNHEIMNVLGDLRYVTDEGFRDFPLPEGAKLPPEVAELPPKVRGRAYAFAPGGPWARRLAGRNVVVVVGDTVFVHGGVLPEHVDADLAELNRVTRAFLAGDRSKGPEVLGRLMAADSPVWTRAYGDGDDPRMCATLDAALTKLGAARMVVGHTVQRSGGITSACNGRLYRIDVGLARHYGGPIAFLRIEGAKVSAQVFPRDDGPAEAAEPARP